MRWITADELRTALDLASLIDALEAGHGGNRPELMEDLIGSEKSRYLIRSAHDGAAFVGSKLITIVPDNPRKRSMPSVQAVIVLFDAESGVPVVTLDATELTYWKTAADSALGARFLSRNDARVLVILGAGGLVPWLVKGHLLARPKIEKVLIWNRTGERAYECAQKLEYENITAQAIDDLEEAVLQGDIISTATMAYQPILQGAWLKPGAHVDLVGSFSPDTREADDETLRRGRLFVDCRESAMGGVGDILIPLEAGIISASDIEGDLYDLVGENISGRCNEEEITIFKNAGGAHLDMMIASALMRRLKRNG